VIQPPSSWTDPSNERNPVDFSPRSQGVSKWIDLGRVIAQSPEGTFPRFTFSGTDVDGSVITDPEGYILDPDHQPFVVHYLGQLDQRTKEYFPGEEPRANWIPPETEVYIEFQAADAVVEGSKEVDPASLSLWSPSIEVADGRQFVRFRVTFDLTHNGGEVNNRTRRPIMKDLRLLYRF
jgi:hypothetical protein